MNKILEINNLIKLHGIECVLNEINLKLYTGDICGILGSYMSGKTTLFNLICGMDMPSNGEVKHDNSVVAITAYNDLIPELTVFENIAISGKIKYIPEYLQRSEQLIDELPQKLPQYTKDLNMFQHYVVKVLRASITRPRVIVIDDFLSGVDKKDAKKIWDIINTCFDIKSIGIIFFTDDKLNLKYATKKYCIKDSKLMEVIN